MDDNELRDAFAAHALSNGSCDFTSPEYIAKQAWKIADAMMEARKPLNSGNSQNNNQQLKEAIALLEECNAQLLSCSGCELTIRTINLKPFSLGFRIATFLKGQQASV